MFTLSFVLLIFSISIKISNAQSIPANKAAQCNLQKGVAIQGYDPVSFYLGDKPIEGKESMSLLIMVQFIFFLQPSISKLLKKTLQNMNRPMGLMCLCYGSNKDCPGNL